LRAPRGHEGERGRDEAQRAEGLARHAGLFVLE
jgi:hypothetical protein